MAEWLWLVVTGWKTLVSKLLDLRSWVTFTGKNNQSNKKAYMYNGNGTMVILNIWQFKVYVDQRLLTIVACIYREILITGDFLMDESSDWVHIFKFLKLISFESAVWLEKNRWSFSVRNITGLIRIVSGIHQQGFYRECFQISLLVCHFPRHAEINGK